MSIARRSAVLAALVLGIFAFRDAPAQDLAAFATVNDGKRVSIEFTLKLSDGSTAESNVGKKPLVFVQGSHRINPALEEAIAGMRVGEKKRITLPPDPRYGSVSPKNIVEVSAERIPSSSRRVGARLKLPDPQGRTRRAVVKEVNGDVVVVDFNSPLAGRALMYEVKILKIE